MFEAKITKGMILKNIIFAIKDTFEIIKWFCSSDGIYVFAMDLCKSTVVRLQLNKELFDKYRCDHNTNFAIKTSSLAKVLKYVNEEIITISCDPKSDKIKVNVEPLMEVEWTQYKIQRIETNVEELDVNPEEDQKSASVYMPSIKLNRIIHDLNQIGKHITISCKENCITFSSKGEMESGFVLLYPSLYVQELQSMVKLEVKEQITHSFYSKFLTQLTKSTSIAPQVLLIMRPLGMLEIVYNINSTKPLDNEFGSTQLASLKLYLMAVVEE